MAKKKTGGKTNAARILDGLGIPYALKEYPVDENDLSAAAVATAVGLPLEMVFKTLVARGDKTGVLMACIPGGAELDLKALAAASGNKRVEMVHLKEVFALTGYVRGGCSPREEGVPRLSRRKRPNARNHRHKRRSARRTDSPGPRRPRPGSRRKCRGALPP